MYKNGKTTWFAVWTKTRLFKKKFIEIIIESFMYKKSNKWANHFHIATAISAKLMLKMNCLPQTIFLSST